MIFMSKKNHALSAIADFLAAFESMEEEVRSLRSEVKALNAAVMALQVAPGPVRGSRRDDEEDGPPPFPTSKSLLNSPHRQKGSIQRFLLGVNVKQDTSLLEEEGQPGTSLLGVYLKWVATSGLMYGGGLGNIQAFGRAVSKSGLFRRTKNAGGMNIHLLDDWKERLEVYRQDIEAYDANKAKMANISGSLCASQGGWTFSPSSSS